MNTQRKGTDKLMVVCTTLSVVFAAVLAVIALQVTYYLASGGEFARKVLAVEPAELQALQAEQAAVLSQGVRWIDAEKGLVGMPIETAMAAVVAEHGGGDR
jgi:hypothetical protein